MFHRFIASCLLSLWLLLGITPLWAHGGAKQFDLHGFGTLGVLHNTDTDMGFQRDFGQSISDRQTSFTTDSVFGLQANYYATPKLTLMLQLLSKYNYESNYSPRASLALAKYITDTGLEFRAGRLGVDMFFRADSRDIGYSYLWVRPPVDFYGLLNFYSYEGVDAAQWFYLDGATLHLKGFAGVVDEDAYFLDGGSEDFNNSPLFGLIAEYETGDWVFRVDMATLKNRSRVGETQPLLQLLSSNGATDLADELDSYDKYFRYYSLAAAWEPGNWRIQGAVSQVDSDTLAFPSYNAAYLSLGYRLDGWTPYILLSGVQSEKAQRSSGLGPAVDAKVQEAIESVYADQRTLALGARFDVRKDLALKVQAERIHSDVVPSVLSVEGEDAWDGDTTVFSLTLDFIF